MSGKKYRTYEREQLYLLPPSLREWLPEGHLAYFIVDVMEELDLSGIYASYEKERRGQPPYDPKVMIALLLYAYCVGSPSSRKIERRSYEDVGFRVVAANQHPDHDTIADFRKRHLKALSSLFLQVLELCRKAKLVKLGHVALDGTKVKANASKHKAMSYGRMKKERKRLEATVKEMLERAEKVDTEEDVRYGKGVRGDELPEELRKRKGRLANIREAMRELEQEAKERVQEEEKEYQAKKQTWENRKERRGGRPPTPPSKKVPNKKQCNFTDSDSRIMPKRKEWVQGYNCQAAVDGEAQVVVAVGVTQETQDKRQLEPMVEAIKKNNGGKLPRRLSADNGYFNQAQMERVEEDVDLYIATERLKHGEKPTAARGRPPNNETYMQKMRRKLRTQKGREVYARRKAVVEPVFGQMKHARGLQHFLLRGLDQVDAEWTMWCMTHNLLKLYRYGSLPGS